MSQLSVRPSPRLHAAECFCAWQFNVSAEWSLKTLFFWMKAATSTSDCGQRDEDSSTGLLSVCIACWVWCTCVDRIDIYRQLSHCWWLWNRKQVCGGFFLIVILKLYLRKECWRARSVMWCRFYASEREDAGRCFHAGMSNSCYSERLMGSVIFVILVMN